MTYADICSSVDALKRKYEETDPAQLCEQLGILIVYKSFGTAPNAIKGFFVEKCRIKAIIVNDDLPDVIKRIIIAHELGHAVLHKDAGRLSAFHEVALFDETSEQERDANLFAAELLLDDNDVFDVLNSDSTFYSAAAKLFIPMELLDFKFRCMKWKGYKLIEPPETVYNDFLKDIHIPKDANYE